MDCRDFERSGYDNLLRCNYSVDYKDEEDRKIMACIYYYEGLCLNTSDDPNEWKFNPSDCENCDFYEEEKDDITREDIE